jgi:hypothetical protein
VSQSVQGKFDLERVKADLLMVLAPSVAPQDYNDTQPSNTQHKRHFRYCFARCCILNVMLSLTFFCYARCRHFECRIYSYIVMLDVVMLRVLARILSKIARRLGGDNANGALVCWQVL